MKKILVVDDEKPISDIIKFNMAKEGYEVLTAFDGREALEVFAAENPDIIIVAQPTRGVDIGAIEYIHDRLLKLRDEGKAILLISADLDEVKNLSDRLMVMYDGEIVAEGEPADFDDMQLGLLMTGSGEGGTESVKAAGLQFDKKEFLNKNMSAVALVLALVLGGIAMLVCGYNPFEAYGSILKGAFIGRKAICQTLVQATPLIFAGLAYTVAKKANLINLGIEGQLYMGALGTSLIALMPVNLPGVIWIPLSLLGGIIFGGLYAGLVGFMKVKFGSNEVIATVMLNTIAQNFVAYVVNYPLKEAGKSMAQTARFSESVWIPKLVDKTQLTAAIIIAVVLCVLIKLLFERTVVGYEIKCVGLNLKASETAGIKIGKIMIIAMVLSGSIAGLLGGTHVLGVDHRLIADFSSGYGFDGIAVAALAADSPLGVILSGIIFGALRAGCMVLNRTTGIPTEFIDVIQAFIILLVAAPLLVKEILRIKNGSKGGKK